MKLSCFSRVDFPVILKMVSKRIRAFECINAIPTDRCGIRFYQVVCRNSESAEAIAKLLEPFVLADYTNLPTNSRL